MIIILNTTILHKVGYKIETDGIYSSATKSAVMSFQKKYKTNLYKKAQEQRITNLEKAVDDLLKKMDNNQDSLYKKQKVYHEQSIQIRDQLRQNQEGLSNQITDLSEMVSTFIRTQNDRTVASFRSSLWCMHKDFINQGYVTPDGLKTFIEMGKLYEQSGGNDIYHAKLLPEVEALEIRYPKGSIYAQKEGI